MTVSSILSQQTFGCNGSTTVFTCQFRVFSASEVVGYLVTIADNTIASLANGTDFTVSAVGADNCVVTTGSAYSSAYRLNFRRATAKLQLTDYRDNDPFPAESHEDALDRLTHIAQEQGASLERAILFPEPEIGQTLPSADRRAGRLMGWDSAGNLLPVIPSPGDASALSIDLASTAAGKGAALVGYDAATAYAAGTVGDAIKNPKTVNTVDNASIGSTEKLTNGGFTGSAAGWSLSNFTYSADTLTHTAGTAGTASQSVGLSADKYHRVSITVTTTTRGSIDIRFDGVTMLDDSGFYVMDVGTYTFMFPWLGPESATTATFAIVTDSTWAGSVDVVSLIEVATEMPLAYSTLASDDTDERMPAGLRFGRYEAGQTAIGDRRTLAMSGASAAWNLAGGVRALEGNVSGIENTALGALAGRYTLTSYGTFAGYSAGKYNTLGQYLTFVGFKAGASNTVGNRNDAFGYHTLLQNTSGSDNFAAGYQALYNVLTTTGNTSVGSQSSLNCRGTENTYFGALAGLLNASASTTYTYSFGTMIGAETKVYGENGTALGFQARVGADGAPVDNSMAIGSGAATLLANSAKIGFGLTKFSTAGRLVSGEASNGDGTAAGITYTVMQFTTTSLTRSGPGAGFSDTTPSAAAIVAAIPGAEVGMGYEIWIRNTTAFVLTLLAGSGVTLDGTTTVLAAQSRMYKVILTNVGSGTEAVTVVGIVSGAN